MKCSRTSALIAVVLFFCHQTYSAEFNIKEVLAGKNRIESQTFKDTSLRLFRLARYSFVKTKWNRVDFRGIEAKQLRFIDFIIDSSNFSGAKFEDCHFENGSFVGVNFNSALFADCTFKNVTLSRSLKEKAILVNVVFKNCSFQD